MPALANVGTTSSGVTTVDPTNPSAGVDQQSSGFVAANQQNGGTTTSAITLPGTIAGAGTAASGTTQAGAKGPNGSTDTAAADGKNAVATPPPPPPTYVSNMKPVNRAADAVAVAPALSEMHPVAKPKAATEKPAASQPVVPVAVAAPKPAPAPAKKAEAAPELPVVTDPGGGRGDAPDGYTFWFGLLVAGALLALAAVTYLKIQRGELPA